MADNTTLITELDDADNRVNGILSDLVWAIRDRASLDVIAALRETAISNLSRIQYGIGYKIDPERDRHNTATPYAKLSMATAALIADRERVLCESTRAAVAEEARWQAHEAFQVLRSIARSLADNATSAESDADTEAETEVAP